MIRATTWMNPDNFTLNERSQPLKVTYSRIPFIQHSRSEEIMEMEDRLAAARGYGQGDRGGFKRVVGGIFVLMELLCVVGVVLDTGTHPRDNTAQN